MPDHHPPRLVRAADESPTPPGALPAIREGTVVRISMRMVLLAAGGLVAFVFWLSVLYSDVQWLKKAMSDLQVDVHEMKVGKP